MLSEIKAFQKLKGRETVEGADSVTEMLRFPRGEVAVAKRGIRLKNVLKSLSDDIPNVPGWLMMILAVLDLL